MKQKLIGGMFWRACFIATNFLLNLAFARYFGAEASGVIFFITNNLSLLLMVGSLNIETGIGFYGARANASQRLLLLRYGIFATVLSILIICLLSIIPLFKTYIDSANWPWYYPLFFVGGNLLVSITSALFFAKGEYFLPNAILAGCTLLLAVFYFMAPIANWQTADVLKLFFWYHFLQGLFMLFAYLLSEKPKVREKEGGSVNFASLLRYSLIALTNNFFLFLLYRLDFWLVEMWTTTEDLGNYIQVSKFGQLLLIAPAIFSSVILPRIAGGQVKNYAKPAAMAFLAMILFSLSCFLLVLTGGSGLFEFLLGKDFNRMHGPALLKIPAILFLSLQFILGTWFSGVKKVRYNLYCTLAGLGVLLLVDLLLIPRFGIYGAAWGSLLAYLAAFCYSIYLYAFYTNQKLADVWFFMLKIPQNWRNYLSSIRKMVGR